MENDKRFFSRALTVLIVLIFLAYVIALVKITVVKGTTLARIFQDLGADRARLRAVNLVPFETILTYARYRESMPFLRWFSNIFGNMLVFVPLGLYLPVLIPGMRRLTRTLPAVVCASASLEALQYLLGTGSTDIDDLWLNTLGGGLGYVLFSLGAKLSARRVPATAWTLALSACFAAAGYATAYREFGVYLGLATFKEEVRGDEQIPRRRSDLTGYIASRADRRLRLTAISSPPPAARQDATAGAGSGPAADEIEVRYDAATRFFDRQTSTRGHTQTTTFVPYAPRSPVDVPDGALASVWGRWEAGRLDAEVIWTFRRQPPAAAAEATGASDAAPTTMVAAPGGLTLPKSPPALHAQTGSASSQKMPFKGVSGDAVTVYKIRRWQDGKALMAVSTSDEARFRLAPRTTFYRQRILRGGKEVYLTPGSREDIVPGKLVSVWGTQQNGVLVADVVCVITAERR